MNRAGYRPEYEREHRTRPEVPARITAIKPQKKRTNRFSLYRDGEFLVGVSSQTLIDFDLRKGDTLTSSLLNRIEEREEEVAVRDYLIRLLGRRDHSRGELLKKASVKGYRRNIVQNILDDLDRKEYLDDRSFAHKFTSDKRRLHHWGPIRIERELLKKGVEKEIIRHVLKEQNDDLELRQICVDLVFKRKRHFLRESDERKRKSKVAAYLQRRGFDFETINQALPEIMQRMNDS